MDVLLTILYLYIGLSVATSVVIALYSAIFDVLCYYNLFGAKPDYKFGYCYGSAFFFTVLIIMSALPFINIYTLHFMFSMKKELKK